MPRAGWVLLATLAGGLAVADSPADRFGPTPARVELTPARTVVPAGKDLLLVATVFDAKGDPRRNRRVEWSLTGPGEIVAVADGGWLPGRSGKKDRTTAVSYTELYDRSAKRGDGATAAVKAGQAWCRVKGGSEETVVTATVPDIADATRRSATAVLEGSGVRGEGSEKTAERDRADDRPARPVSRPGGPILTPDPSPLNPPSARPAELRLDATGPSGVGVGQPATVTLTAANRGGTASDGVSLLASLPDGLELVSSDPPPAVRQGPDEKDLRWGLGPLAAGGVADRVQLTVRASRRGEYRIRAAVEAGDGQRDNRDVAVAADDASLGVSLEVPPTAAEGDRVPVTVVVTNTGRVPVRNAVAFVTADAELMTDFAPKELSVGTVSPGETRRAKTTLTAVRAGRPAVRVSVTADGGVAQQARGEVIVQQGSGGRGQGSEGRLDAKIEDRPPRSASLTPDPTPLTPAPQGRPALVLEVVDPPGRVPVGDTVRVRVKVRNRGTATARNVDVSAAGEGSLVAVGGVGADRRRAAGDGGRVQFPTLPEVKPGTVAVFEVELKGSEVGSGRVSAAVRAEYLSRPLKEEHEARVVER